MGSLLVFCASFATGYARLEDFTLRVMNKCVVLDVRMNPTPSPTTTNALILYDLFFPFWRPATVLPRRNNLLHDLITQVFLRSLQYAIVELGFIDAFVHAHHQHRRKNRESQELW